MGTRREREGELSLTVLDGGIVEGCEKADFEGDNCRVWWSRYGQEPCDWCRRNWPDDFLTNDDVAAEEATWD